MLSKNTVDICFIHAKQKDGKYELWFDHPLSKTYPFYVSPEIKKQIDIGSVIEHHNPDYEDQAKEPYCFGVIVNNYTKVNAEDKFTALTDVKQPGHLRTFLERQFDFTRNKAASNRVYNAFRQVSHPYWVEKYKNQKK